MGTPRSLDSSGTLERGLAVLEHVGRQQEISTNAIAKQLGLSRSAAYRIVGTLKNLEYLEADRATGRVRLGTRLVELGARAMAATDLHRCAPRYLASLAERSGETSYLAVPDNDTMVYVATERSANAVTLACRLGTRKPLHATSLGKAWLAALPEQDRAERIRRMKLDSLTLKTIIDPARLLDELAGPAVAAGPSTTSRMTPTSDASPPRSAITPVGRSRRSASRARPAACSAGPKNSARPSPERPPLCHFASVTCEPREADFVRHDGGMVFCIRRTFADS